MTEEEYQILEDLYTADRWPDNRRGNSLMKKCEALYGLARQVEEGCIVELGTHHGCGTIPLAFGAWAGNRGPVYTIDDYTKKEGWAGEGYYPQDKARFLDCIRVAGVQDRVMLIEKDVTKANKGWSLPIALLFWDLGMRDRLSFDFWAWGHLIIPGGIFAIREGGDRFLGSREVMKSAVESGVWAYGEQFPDGHTYTLVKRE